MKRPILAVLTLWVATVLVCGHVTPSDAQDADFIEISGVSGRNVLENVSIAVWLWTAPATGSVKFDTRGSSVDTLLAVLTGDADNPTEVAINDDIGGTLQSAVRFTAQQDQAYYIGVYSYDELPGTFVLNWQMTSASDTPAPLRGLVFDNPGPGEPSYVLAGHNASVWYWTTDGTTTQSLYVSTDGSVSVRTFYDAAGRPHKVLDERTGSWMLIRRYDPENVDFWFYDKDGAYQGGLAVFEDEGQYYYAEIDDEPVHAGKRITGSLHPTEASWTGSYTLQVDMSMIHKPQAVPQGIAALIDSFSPEGRSTSIDVGWQSGFAVTLKSLGAWLSPGEAAAQSAVRFQDALVMGGFAMVVAAISGTVVLQGLATAGVAAIVSGLLTADATAHGIRGFCSGMTKTARDFCYMAANHLTDPKKRGLAQLLLDMKERAQSKLSRISDTIKSGIQALKSTVQAILPDGGNSEVPKAANSPNRRIPDDNSTSETVRGTMEREGRESVDVVGTVTPDGTYSLEDEAGRARIELSTGVDADAPAEGSFELHGVTGTVEVYRDGYPVVVQSIPDWEAEVGDIKTIDLSRYFEAADEAAIRYDGVTPDPDIAIVSVSGTKMTLEALGPGSTHVFVQAWSTLDGKLTTETFDITVRRESTSDLTRHHRFPTRKISWEKAMQLAAGSIDISGLGATLLHHMPKNPPASSWTWTQWSSDPSVIRITKNSFGGFTWEIMGPGTITIHTQASAPGLGSYTSELTLVVGSPTTQATPIENLRPLPAHCEEQTEHYYEEEDPAWFQCWYWVVQENASGSWCHTAADPVSPNETIAESAEGHLDRVKRQNWHAEKSTIYPCLPGTQPPHAKCWSCDFLRE